MDQQNPEVKESKVKTILVVEIDYHIFEFDNPQQAFTFYMAAINHRENKEKEGKILDIEIYAVSVKDESEE